MLPLCPRVRVDGARIGLCFWAIRVVDYVRRTIRNEDGVSSGAADPCYAEPLEPRP
jgi:hypothetical protein